jgi:hypothetical protein
MFYIIGRGVTFLKEVMYMERVVVVVVVCIRQNTLSFSA